MSKRGPETPVEERLLWLEGFGFSVPKFALPGKTGGMDRLILWPRWSPAPPVLVECKAPGKAPRPLQAELADDWRARGVDVREYVDTEDKAIYLCDLLLCEAVDRFMANRARNHPAPLPVHIIQAHKLACDRNGWTYLRAF